ncbi:MAG TPA: hypothetical protein VGX72_01240 [Solirubrobacteraceae bacterium]|jgi:hypothetical protein|nr:hypothetical protein [Solirubrobacteraceae bacterium]
MLSFALGAWAGDPDADAAAAPALRTALIVFAPADESQLAGVAGLSIGIMSASQGQYSQTQLLLDIGQGARIASSAYPTPRPPVLSLVVSGAGSGATDAGATGTGASVMGATVAGWRAARRRAQAAPQLLQPGLLASQIPGGAGYAGLTGAATGDSVLAAESDGHVAAVSLGPASTLLARIATLLRSERLVIADLPTGVEGHADLLALARGRAANELLLVVQRVERGSAGELLWAAAAGLAGGADRELSSQSTNERGLIASFDLAPTILDYLGLRPIPPEVRGKPIVTDGPLHSASLRSLIARLRVIGGRRLPALGFLLGAWALLATLAAPWARWRARAMRVGALGVLWAPVTVLVPAALEPSAAVEYATITLVCLALGALTDALVPWPRAVLAPAVVAVVVLTADALAGTQLLMRSMLGPDPILGARFYGLGNELKSGLAVLVAAAVAAALFPATRDRRAALAMVGAGVLLAIVEGSARIGAGVGGVILVSFGFAVATIMLLPGALTRRRGLVVLVAPAVGLVVLAGIDLATSHGAGHFTGSVLDASSAGELRDVIVRRYSAAWDELRNHAMPVASAVALVCAGLGIRRRARLLTPVADDPAWFAALAGGLAAGVVGALVEDSGPVLFVVVVFALGCVLTYLWGRPPVEVEITGAPSPELRIPS